MWALLCNFSLNLSVCELPIWKIRVSPRHSRVLCYQAFRYHGEGNLKCTLKSPGFGFFFSDHTLNGKHFFVLINCSCTSWGLVVWSRSLIVTLNSQQCDLSSSAFKVFLIIRFGELKAHRLNVTCITPLCASGSRNGHVSCLSCGTDSICLCHL